MSGVRPMASSTLLNNMRPLTSMMLLLFKFIMFYAPFSSGSLAFISLCVPIESVSCQLGRMTVFLDVLLISVGRSDYVAA